MEEKKVRKKAGSMQKIAGEGLASALSRDMVHNILTDFGHETRISHHPGAHTHRYSGVAVTADGSKLVTENRDRTASLWDIAAGQILMLFRDHSDVLTGNVTFTADEKHVVTAARDGTIRLWDCTTGKCALVLSGHKGTVSAVSVSPDGRRVVSAGLDDTMRVWSLPGGTCERVIPLKGMPIWKLLITKDCKVLVSKGSYFLEPVICLWRFPDAGDFLQIALGSYEKPLYDITVTDDEKVVIAVGKALYLFDARTGKKEKTISLGYQPTRVTAGSDNRRLVAACYPRTILVINRETGTREKYFRGPEEEVTDMDITPDGKTLCTVSYRVCRVWDMEAEKCLRTIGDPASEITCLRLSEDGKWLALLDQEGWAKILDLVQGSPRIISGNVRTIVFLALSNLVATGHKDGKVRLWNVEIGKAGPIRILEAHKSEISSLVPFRGGQRLATNAYNEGVRFWDTQSGFCVRTYPIPGMITAIAVDEDEQQMAVGFHHLTGIDMYDLQSGDLITRLEGHDEYIGTGSLITDLHFLPGRQGLISRGGDGRIILWNRDTHKAMQTIEEPEGAALSIVVQDAPYKRLSSALKFQSIAIRFMTVDKDGRRVVTANGTGELKIWDLETGEWEVCYPDEGIFVHSVALSHDERTLFAAFHDGTMRVIERDSGIVRCTFGNVRKGFFWFTPPDEYAPEGWVWTDRKDLLSIVEEDSDGRVLGSLPFDHERRRAYIHTRNNEKLVLARLRGLEEYERMVRSYLAALTKKQQAALGHPAPMLPKRGERPQGAEAILSRDKDDSGKKGEQNV